MDSADLIRMANQIATNFTAYGEDEAVAQTAGHMRMFWEPRMITALGKLLDQSDSGLTPLARKAAINLLGQDD